MTPLVRLGDLGAVFISEDEPDADVHWEALRAVFPKATRLTARPSSSTLRRAAALSVTDRFVVVQGDTRIDPKLAEHAVEDDLMASAATIVWPTRNAVNGLCHATGAIRCCAGRALADPGAEPSTEIPAPRSFGTTIPDGTPNQAFRSAFREGVRLGLVRGRAPGPPRPGDQLPVANLKRLLAWTTVGLDRPSGLWCLYGARLGCKMVQLQQFDVARMVRPEWIEGLWRDWIAPAFTGDEATCPHTGYRWDRAKLAATVVELGDSLRADLGLDIVELDTERSRFFRSVWARDFDLSAFDRLGNLYRDGGVLPRDLTKAAEHYQIGADLGDANAADNLARLHLKGAGVPRDVDTAIALLAQATSMGSPHAPYHLAQAYRGVARTAGSAAKAAALLRLAAERGFVRAHAALAEIHHAGDGVGRDDETALVHGLLAGASGETIVRSLRAEVPPEAVARAEARARALRAPDPDG